MMAVRLSPSPSMVGVSSVSLTMLHKLSFLVSYDIVFSTLSSSCHSMVQSKSLLLPFHSLQETNVSSNEIQSNNRDKTSDWFQLLQLYHTKLLTFQ